MVAMASMDHPTLVKEASSSSPQTSAWNVSAARSSGSSSVTPRSRRGRVVERCVRIHRNTGQD